MTDRSDPEKRSVKPPDQAVLEESEHVVDLSNDRYLVSSSAIDPPKAQRIRQLAEYDDEDGGDAHSAPAPTAAPPSIDHARSAVQASLRDSDSLYAIELTAILEGALYAERIETDDVVEAFEVLNRRFASGVARGNASAAEVIDILLTESELDAERRSHHLSDVLAAYGLDRSDSIGALIDAIDHNDR